MLTVLRACWVWGVGWVWRLCLCRELSKTCSGKSSSYMESDMIHWLEAMCMLGSIIMEEALGRWEIVLPKDQDWHLQCLVTVRRRARDETVLLGISLFKLECPTPAAELLTVDHRRERRGVFSKSVPPDKSAAVQWEAPHPWIFEQHKLDWMDLKIK